MLSILENQNLNNGVILMNRKTAKQFLTFDRSEIGGDLAQDLFKDGLTALQQAKIMLSNCVSRLLILAAWNSFALKIQQDFPKIRRLVQYCLFRN